MALRDFLAVINHVDVARSSRFVVEIQPPNIPGLGIKPQQQINLMCQDVTFPGQNIRTSTDDLRQGPTREIGQAVTYGSTNMTFICTPGLPEKLFFEAWQGLMFNRITWQAKYYKSYIGQIKLRQLDRTDMVRYGVILYEAYPKIINAQDYSNTAADTMQTLQVEFNFHHWAMDEEVYDNTERYGSRNEDEDKPKRTTKAGYENMTYEQAQAFLRQNSIETLMGESGGTAAHAQLLKGAQGIDVTAAASLLPQQFKGYNQAVGTLPLSGRKGTGLAVDAEKVPAQQKLADPVKTPNKSKGTYNYFSGWSGKGGDPNAGEEAYGRETTITTFGDKTNSVAWASQPGNRKHAGEIVAAAEAKAQAAEDFAANSTMTGIAGGKAGDRKAKRLRAEADALYARYGLDKNAYRSEPTGDVVAAKVESKRAATWVNPNTGQTVGGGSGNVGTAIKNGFAQMQRMWPGSYSGAVASTTSGVMKQAVSSKSVSAKVGGVSIRATISLGGVGGGGGLSNLFAARGLTSGIGIPRFGGIPAVRGAGFQVRSVGYKRPSSGGRANHNAEGGESGDGRDDR